MTTSRDICIETVKIVFAGLTGKLYVFFAICVMMFSSFILESAEVMMPEFGIKTPYGGVFETEMKVTIPDGKLSADAERMLREYPNNHVSGFVAEAKNRVWSPTFFYVSDPFMQDMVGNFTGYVKLPPQSVKFDENQIFHDLSGKKISWNKILVKTVVPYSVSLSGKKKPDGTLMPETEIKDNMIPIQGNGKFIFTALKIPGKVLKNNPILLLNIDNLLGAYIDGKAIPFTYHGFLRASVIDTDLEDGIKENEDYVLTLKFPAITAYPASFRIPDVSAVARKILNDASLLFVTRIFETMKVDDPNKINNLRNDNNALLNYAKSTAQTSLRIAALKRGFEIAVTPETACNIYNVICNENQLSLDEQIALYEKAVAIPALAPHWSRAYSSDIIFAMIKADGSFSRALEFSKTYKKLFDENSITAGYILELLFALERGDSAKVKEISENIKSPTLRQINPNAFMRVAVETDVKQLFGLDWDYDAMKRYAASLARDGSESALFKCIRENLERSKTMYIGTPDKNLLISASGAYREVFAPYAERYDSHIEDYVKLLQKQLGISARAADIKKMTLSIGSSEKKEVKPASNDVKFRPGDIPSGAKSDVLTLFENDLVPGNTILSIRNVRRPSELKQKLYPPGDVTEVDGYTFVQSLSELICLKGSDVLWRARPSIGNVGQNQLQTLLKYGKMKVVVYDGRIVICRMPFKNGIAMNAYDISDGKLLWSLEPDFTFGFGSAKMLADPVIWRDYLVVLKTAPSSSAIPALNGNPFFYNSLVALEIALVEPESGQILASNKFSMEKLNLMEATSLFNPNDNRLISNLFSANPVIDGSTLFQYTANGIITAFNLEYMTPEWTRFTPSNALSFASNNFLNENMMSGTPPRNPNLILKSGDIIAVKSVDSPICRIMAKKDGKLIKEMELEQGRMTGNPDLKTGMLYIITPSKLNAYSVADGKLAASVAVSDDADFALEYSNDMPGPVIVSDGKIISYGKNLEKVSEIVLPEKFIFTNLSGKNVYGTSRDNMNSVLVYPENAIAGNGGKTIKKVETGYERLDALKIYATTTEPYDVMYSDEKGMFVMAPSLRNFIFAIQPDMTHGRLVPYSNAKSFHVGKNFFYVADQTSLLVYSRETGILQNSVNVAWNDDLTLDLSKIDTDGDNVYCVGDFKMYGGAVYKIENGVPRELYSLPVPVSWVTAILDKGETLVVDNISGDSKKKYLTVLKYSHEEKAYRPVLDKDGRKEVCDLTYNNDFMVTSRGENTVIYNKNRYESMYLISHRDGSSKELKLPTPLQTFGGIVSVVPDDSGEYMYVKLNIKSRGFSWYCIDMKKKDWLNKDFVSSSVPKRVGDTIYGCAFNTAGTIDKLRFLAYDIKTDKVVTNGEFTDREYLRNAGLCHVGTFVKDGLFYDLMSPWNAYSPVSTGLLVSRSPGGEFKVGYIPKIAAPNMMYPGKDKLLFFLNGSPASVPYALFTSPELERNELEIEKNDRFDFVPDGQRTEWEDGDFKAIGGNLYRIVKRGNTLYFSFIIRDIDTLKKISSYGDALNVRFAVYRAQDIGLRQDLEQFIYRNANPQIYLRSPDNIAVRHDTFMSADVLKNEFFIEFVIPGLAKSNSPAAFRDTYGDYVCEIFLSDDSSENAYPILSDGKLEPFYFPFFRVD